jgi:hypothetical protein
MSKRVRAKNAVPNGFARFKGLFNAEDDADVPEAPLPR